MLDLFRERLSAAKSLSGKSALMAQRRFANEAKQTARQRISIVLEGGPFLELSSLAAFDMYGGEVHSAGVVTGIGRVRGRYMMLVSNEGAVKGGTWFEPSCRKVLRAQQLAALFGIGCVYIVDSGGAFLPDQANVYPELFGRIFKNQAEMSASGLCQIAVVVGLSTAGGAYVPAMCDFVIITEKGSSIFLAGPPLVKSATGEIVDSDTLGGGTMHTRVSGVTDYLARDEIDALGNVLLNLVDMLCTIQYTQMSHTQAKRTQTLHTQTTHTQPPHLGEQLFCHISPICEFPGISVSNAQIRDLSCTLLQTWGPVTATHFERVARSIAVKSLVILEHQWGFLDTEVPASFLKALAKVPFKIGIVTGGCAAVAVSSKGLNPGPMFVWPDAQFKTARKTVDAFASTAIINDDGIIEPSETGNVIYTFLDVVQTCSRASL